MAKKLYVRFSTAADEKAVFDFYASNQHSFVFQRDPAVWKERIAAGAVTLIEDDKGHIVASSISYPVIVDDGKGNPVHRWTEIGSTRVSLEGIGLFKTLISAQILRAYLLEPPLDRFALEIVLANAHSKHVFLKNGATPFDIPPALSQKVMATVADTGGQKVEWFQLGIETIPQFAANLLEVMKNPQVKQHATGEVYEIDFSKCVLVNMFQQEVRHIAAQKNGDPKAPDMKKRIVDFPAKFKP